MQQQQGMDIPRIMKGNKDTDKKNQKCFYIVSKINSKYITWREEKQKVFLILLKRRRT